MNAWCQQFPTMDVPGFTGAALYTGEGRPVRNVPVPSLDGPDGLIHSRPVCRLLFELDNTAAQDRDDVDLIYVLPIGSGPHMIAPDDLAEIVAVLDQSGRIALHGSHAEAVEHAIKAVLLLSGGGRA